MELSRWVFGYFTRGMRDQTRRTLRLGEGNHVTNGFCTRHQRDEAVKTESQDAMRRCAVLQRFEQDADFFLRFFLADVARLEYIGLHFFPLDTYRAAADLPPVAISRESC